MQNTECRMRRLIARDKLTTPHSTALTLTNQRELPAKQADWLETTRQPNTRRHTHRLHRIPPLQHTRAHRQLSSPRAGTGESFRSAPSARPKRATRRATGRAGREGRADRQDKDGDKAIRSIHFSLCLWLASVFCLQVAKEPSNFFIHTVLHGRTDKPAELASGVARSALRRNAARQTSARASVHLCKAAAQAAGRDVSALVVFCCVQLLNLPPTI